MTWERAAKAALWAAFMVGCAMTALELWMYRDRQRAEAAARAKVRPYSRP